MELITYLFTISNINYIYRTPFINTHELDKEFNYEHKRTIQNMKRVKELREIQHSIQKKYYSPEQGQEESTYRALNTQPNNYSYLNVKKGNNESGLDNKSNTHVHTENKENKDNKNNKSQNYNDSVSSNRLKSSINYEKFNNKKKNLNSSIKKEDKKEEKKEQ